jgi:Mrp family chromosome partitioning ATPase
VGVLADALMMGRRTDAVLMVARAGLAPGELVEEAATRLRQTGADLVGTVLNGVELSEDTLRLGARYFEPVHPNKPSPVKVASR